MPLCHSRLSCRYHGILDEILQDLNLTEGFPPALLEHIVISNTDCNPNQRGMFASKPHASTESIDLLMCAASMGDDSVLSALLRAGTKLVLLRQSDLLYNKHIYRLCLRLRALHCSALQRLCALSQY